MARTQLYAWVEPAEGLDSLELDEARKLLSTLSQTEAAKARFRSDST
jgi:hypothetical protein